jgi:TetR/AcrR family transcriptional repressor of nem operon
METFWMKGFEAASLDDLCLAMGISRSSLYQAFGSKAELLLATFDLYDRKSVARIERHFAPGVPVRQAVAGFFEDFRVEALAGSGRHGCYLGKCSAELGATDVAVGERLKQSFTTVQAAFRDALERAQRAGDLAADRDPQALARFLTAVSQGMRLMGKVDPDPGMLDDVIGIALRCLD